jgi:protein-tyrosine phosphatase
MESLFWLVPGKLAGRPGPDRAPWDLATLRRGGIGAILSVNDGLLCHPADFRRHDVRYACIPLSDNAPPQPGDEVTCLGALPAAYAFVQEQLADDRPTVVHCSSGKDRTGLFLAYYLVRTARLAPVDAIAAVKNVRPVALSAIGWDEFALEVLAASGNR